MARSYIFLACVCSLAALVSSLAATPIKKSESSTTRLVQTVINACRAFVGDRDEFVSDTFLDKSENSNVCVLLFMNISFVTS